LEHFVNPPGAYFPSPEAGWPEIQIPGSAIQRYQTNFTALSVGEKCPEQAILLRT
jgi:hypothetical protein